MTTPIEKALDEINFKIPRDILELAFGETSNYTVRFKPSIDTVIQDKVLVPKVIVDCDLNGGVQRFIPINGIHLEYINNTECVFQMPADRLQGREIMSVFSIGYYEDKVSQYIPTTSSKNSLNMHVNKLVDSLSGTYMEMTNRIGIWGPNTVHVRERMAIEDRMVLHCVVSNAQHMSNLPPRAFLAFSELCILAVKAYIYNTLVLRLDTGAIRGGVSLGKISDIVNEYADSAELYDLYLKEKWAKKAFTADPIRNEKHLRRLL